MSEGGAASSSNAQQWRPLTTASHPDISVYFTAGLWDENNNAPAVYDHESGKLFVLEQDLWKPTIPQPRSNDEGYRCSALFCEIGLLVHDVRGNLHCYKKGQERIIKVTKTNQNGPGERRHQEAGFGYDSSRNMVVVAGNECQDRNDSYQVSLDEGLWQKVTSVVPFPKGRTFLINAGQNLVTPKGLVYTRSNAGVTDGWELVFDSETPQNFKAVVWDAKRAILLGAHCDKGYYHWKALRVDNLDAGWTAVGTLPPFLVKSSTDFFISQDDALVAIAETESSQLPLEPILGSSSAIVSKFPAPTVDSSEALSTLPTVAMAPKDWFRLAIPLSDDPNEEGSWTDDNEAWYAAYDAHDGIDTRIPREVMPLVTDLCRSGVCLLEIMESFQEPGVVLISNKAIEKVLGICPPHSFVYSAETMAFEKLSHPMPSDLVWCTARTYNPVTTRAKFDNEAISVLDPSKYDFVADTFEDRMLQGSYLGGYPNWLQEDETPNKSCCSSSKVVFLGRFGGSDRFLDLPEGGSTNVFVCTKCWEIQSVSACY